MGTAKHHPLPQEKPARYLNLLLLLLVAIIGGIGTYSCVGFNHVDELQSQISSLSNLKQLGLSCQQFSEYHHNALPRLNSLADFKADTFDYSKIDSLYYNSYPRANFRVNSKYSGVPLNQVGADAILVYDPVAVNGEYVVLLGNLHGAVVPAGSLQNRLN